MSVAGFSVVRFALGLAEGGNFPGAIKTVGLWYPKSERATATGLFNSGANVGIIVAAFAVPFIVDRMQWPWAAAFCLTGGLGLVWLTFWLLLYDRPERHPRVSPAELAFIRSDPPDPPARISWFSLLAASPDVGLYVGHVLGQSRLVVLRLLDAEIPGKQPPTSARSEMFWPLLTIFVMADVGSIAGGWFSSWLIQRGVSVNVARKTTFLVCSFGAMPVACVARVGSLWIAVFLVGLAAAAHAGFAANLYTIVSDTVPRKAVSSVVGIGGAASGLGMLVLSTLIGGILDWTERRVRRQGLLDSVRHCRFGLSGCHGADSPACCRGLSRWPLTRSNAPFPIPKGLINNKWFTRRTDFLIRPGIRDGLGNPSHEKIVRIVMTPRQRVQAALNHTQPDYTPCDYYATPEIHEALLRHFGLGEPRRIGGTMGGSASALEDGGVAERLGVDIRYVNPPYIGPPLASYPDGSSTNLWGIRRRPMPNEYGEYAEPVGSPYAAWTTIEEADKFPWPSPDWFDYAALPALCAKYPDLAIIAGGTYVQDFINGVAFGRGIEQVFLDIALGDPVYLHLVERRHRFYMAYIERILEAAGRTHRRGPLRRRFRQPAGLVDFAGHVRQALRRQEEGTVRPGPRLRRQGVAPLLRFQPRLFPRFIQCGMDALQTVQPQAAGMNPYELKAEFAGRIALHGAVDVQGWLQRSTPKEIEAEVNRLMDEVGRGGGYILAPSHHIQPDTPLGKRAGRLPNRGEKAKAGVLSLRQGVLQAAGGLRSR